MSDRKPHLLAVSIAAGALLLIAGGWLAHREISCAQRAEQAAAYPGAQVRRGSDGACRTCREQGPLYDIMFDTCSDADEPYSGLRFP